MSAAVALLKRDAVVSVPDDVSALVDNLLTQASLTLNYRPVSRAREREDAKLRQALVDCAIQPFRLATVQRYQRRMQRGHMPQAFAVAIGCFAVAAAGGFAATTMASWEGWWDLLAAVAGVGVAVIAVFGIGCVCVGCSKGGRWRATRLDVYQESVPAFALQTALLVKEQYRDAQVFVEAFTTESERTTDPFLFVTTEYGHTRYYLEVWDEPRFEQRKQA